MRNGGDAQLLRRSSRSPALKQVTCHTLGRASSVLSAVTRRGGRWIRTTVRPYILIRRSANTVICRPGGAYRVHDRNINDAFRLTNFSLEFPTVVWLQWTLDCGCVPPLKGLGPDHAAAKTEMVWLGDAAALNHVFLARAAVVQERPLAWDEGMLEVKLTRSHTTTAGTEVMPNGAFRALLPQSIRPGLHFFRLFGYCGLSGLGIFGRHAGVVDELSAGMSREIEPVIFA